MNHHESAILRTILYADVFQFAMTLEEITRYLISPEVIPQEQISHSLQSSPILKQLLHIEMPYICLATHQENIALRQARHTQANAIWDDAQQYGRWLACIPFVKMVALTGALAVRNPSSYNDDFDYVLVTQSGRVWMARGFAVLLVRFVRLLGRELCPNYVLAEDRLKQKDHNLYIAHEVMQMQPIYGAAIYEAMLADNTWTSTYLANADALSCQELQEHPIKHFFEWALGGWLGDKIEAWEYRRKVKRFLPKLEQKQSNATITSEEVKGHFEDNGYPALTAYYERLMTYNLERYDIALAGD